MGSPGLSTDPLSYLEYVEIARKIQFYHGGNEQNARQVQRLEKVKNRSFLVCLNGKNTCRKNLSGQTRET